MANRRWSLWGIVAGAVLLIAAGITLLLQHHRPLSVTSPMSNLAPHAVPNRTGPGQNGAQEEPTAAPLLMPTAGKILAGFGWQYSGALNEWYYNPGITIAAPAGADVRAAWGGTVAAVTNEPPVGLTVRIDDGNGFTTVYGHLGQALVKVGATVHQGDTIGTVGAASIYARQPGPHVDFQVLHGSVASDPMSYLHPSS
ncbi:MAG: M23 family metallopeptidase [Firmicutes bacterium]|nr:M23 family metallopeptidase [Alicyclobacillaceae bacterium]MCL6497707.1 M23 family metallopeptidase [Bacillota bacterium]